MTYFSPQLALSRRKRSWLQSKLSTLTALDGTRPAAVADFEAWRFAIPALGPELVTNGGFDTNSDWTLANSATISGGNLNIPASVGSGNRFATQAVNTTPGAVYRIEFTLGTMVGNISWQIRNADDTAELAVGSVRTSPGTYVEYFTATESSVFLIIVSRFSGTTSGTLDNLSLREVMLGDAPNLVPNPNFTTSDISAYAAENSAVLSYSSGALRITNGAGTEGRARLTLPCKSGVTYRVSARAYAISSGSQLAWSIRNSTTDYYARAGTGSLTTVSRDVYSTDTTIEINLYTNNVAAAAWGEWDNVYIIELPTTPTLRECTFAEWFTYTSSTPNAETYTDASGVLRRQPYGRNLINFSQNFESGGWTKSNLTVMIDAAVAPDGTMTAEKLVEDSTTNVRLVSRTPASVTWSDNETYTASVYAKAGERDLFWIESRTKVPGFPQGFFNLSTGTVVSALNGATAAIEDAGNGWYRCSITASASTGSTGPNILFGPCISPPSRSYLGDGSSGLYVWGAQLEHGSVPSAYQPTTSNGEGVDTPRQDYSLGSRRLLLENASTNLLPYSQDVSGVSWALLAAAGINPVGSGSALNQTTAPDGTMTADFVSEYTNYGAHYFYNTLFTDSSTKTFSVFLKAGTRTKVRIQIGANSAAHGVYAEVDLLAGTIGSATLIPATPYTAIGQSIQYFGNGWYRCSVTATTPPSTHVGYVILLNSSGVRDYTGDGVSGLYVWGAQMEQSSFASSYIPTQGSTVTRAINTAQLSPLIVALSRLAEFSAIVRFDLQLNDGTYQQLLQFDDGTNNNRISLAYQSVERARLDVSVSSTTNPNAQVSIDGTEPNYGMGFSLRPNSAFVASDGGISSENTSALKYTGATAGYLARRTPSGPAYANGRYKLIALYPRAISSASLAALAVE